MALNKKQSLVLLFTLSLACLGYGVCSWFIDKSIGLSLGIMIVIGITSLMIIVVNFRKGVPPVVRRMQMRRMRYVSIFVLMLVGLSIIFSFLGVKFEQRLDVTKYKTNTLDEQTIKVAQEVQDPIKMTVFHINVPPKYVEDLMREYERASNNFIETEIIDPIVQISYASQFNNIISGKEKKVIVRAGTKEQVIDFTNKPLSENDINNALVRVTRPTQYACFLNGHKENEITDRGDTGLTIFSKHLLANNIISKDVLLETTQSVPEECNVLILAGLKDHLTITEEAIIQEYLLKGGDALFLIEHTAITTPDVPLTEEEFSKNPSLNNLLNQWGIKVANDVVVDLASHASGDVGSPATKNYMAHRAIVKDLDYTFFVRPRSISMKSDRRKTIRLAPLVMTQSESQSWGETDRTLDIKFDEIEDRGGPVPIAYVGWEPRDALEQKISDTKIAVFTDVDFLTNAYIGSYSNAEMGLNTIKWLNEMDYQVLVDKKEIKVSQLNLTSKQKRSVAVILFLVPMLVGMTGSVVWMKNS